MKAQQLGRHPYCWLSGKTAIAVFVVLALFETPQRIFAQSTQITIKNNCSYTVYPGIYPASYSNGGWQMNPGASVTFSLSDPWTGRIWGRIGCDGSSPAICETGQCGGTGLQCAGTTGVKGTSLVELNLDYQPSYTTDDYDVSYVDGMDNPIGLTLSNSSCVQPSTCSSIVSSCPSGLGNGPDCMSPCTAYNTDEFCCTGGDNTPATCLESTWPSNDQAYVNDIHNACPNDYAWPYDDGIGNHTCPTGTSYTMTFCPNGSSSGGGTTITNGSYVMNPQNAHGLVLDDWQGGTESGNQIDIYPANNTGAQTWVFSNVNVQPAGFYNIAVSYGAYCVTASGSTSGSLVNLQPCNGSPAQAWQAVPASVGYTFNPANNTSLCLDVQGDSSAPETLVQAWTCNQGNNEQWVLN